MPGRLEVLTPGAVQKAVVVSGPLTERAPASTWAVPKLSTDSITIRQYLPSPSLLTLRVYFIIILSIYIES